MRWFWMASVVALFYGCGDAKRPEQITNVDTGGKSGSGTTTGGRSSTGGALGDAGAGGDTTVDVGGAGGEGGGAVVDSRGPVVEITSPPAVSDPDQGEVLLQDSVTVLCRVSKSTASGSLAVDPSTVKLAMLDGAGKVLKPSDGAATGNPGEFSATFVVSGQPSGALGFRCTASDIAAIPHTGSHEIGTFVDRGPKISVIEPANASAHALTPAVSFEFSVEPVVLAPGDEQAAIGEVTLTVNGLSVDDLAPAPNRPGVYRATVDFADRTLFPDTPSGEIPVEITAANQRSPTPAQSSSSYRFVLDAEGPVIKVTAPAAGDIVGRVVVLKFSVTDALSGVADESVTVKLNDEVFAYAPPPSEWTKNGSNYTFTFDSTKIKGSVVQAVVDILANDVAGNAALGASLKLYLDDYPPIVSLDPGPVRLLKIGPPRTCSQSFDPLGEAASDGSTVPPFATFRALVWDETNFLPGMSVQHLSLTDRGSVRLYLQPDPDQALLSDADGDGWCDTINDVDASGDSLPFQQLTPLAPDGDMPHFIDDRLTAEPVVPETECGLAEGTTKALCTNQISDLHKVIKHTVADGVEPVVYAVSPESGLLCTGDGWDLSRYQGWVCLASRARDVALNPGISAPLRVCVDVDDDPSTEPCAGTAMPSCTDGCTPPPEFPGGVFSYTNP